MNTQREKKLTYYIDRAKRDERKAVMDHAYEIWRKGGTAREAMAEALVAVGRSESDIKEWLLAAR